MDPTVPTPTQRRILGGIDYDSRPLTARWPQLILFVGCLGVLLVAYSLDANAAGHGTHRALGLPPCGFLTVTGQPCMTCGMTTTFSELAHGHFLHAFLNQPAGFLLGLATACMTLVAGWSLITGMSLRPLADALLRPRIGLMLLAIFLAGWAYKIIIHNQGYSPIQHG